MTEKRTYALEVIRRELAKQDIEWKQAKVALARLCDAGATLPRSVLAEIDEVFAAEPEGPININLVRG